MNGTTFSSSEQAISYLQSKYGSADFARWQSLRREFWSYVTYPAAGQSVITFFGDAIGSNGITTQFTNMPKSGSLGQQHFLLKAIRMDYFLDDYEVNKQFTNDASALYSDIINGVFQSGVLELLIGDRVFCQINKPFLQASPADGRIEVFANGLRSLTLAEAAPNTFSSQISAFPVAELGSRKENGYLVDPNILIEAEQQFQVRLRYDSGALAALATTVINDSTNPLKVGCTLDGVVFRPVQ